MRERIKSLVLIFLVLMSFYMTGQTWLVNYAPLQPPSSDVEVVQPEPQEILTPSAINLHVESGPRQYYPGDAGFEDAWSLFRGLISGAPSVSVRVSTQAAWLQAISAGSIELKLTGRVPLRMWLEALSIQPWGLTKDYSVNRVLISSNSNAVYFWNTHESLFLVWDNVSPHNNLGKVKEEVSEAVERLSKLTFGQALRLLDPPYRNQAAPWVYVPRTPGAWPELQASSEQGKSQEIVDSFFSDLRLVRKIGLREGRMLFSYGAVDVHVDSNGSIQYSNSVYLGVPQDIQARASAMLSSALDFVARHGGWPAEARLSLMEQRNQEHMHLEFVPFATITVAGSIRYAPIVSYRSQISLNVTEGVSERVVSEYSRFVYNPLQAGPSLYTVRNPEDALKVAEEQGALISNLQITDVYLGYYQRPIDQSEEFLFPVWVIEQGSHQVFVHAFVPTLIKP